MKTSPEISLSVFGQGLSSGASRYAKPWERCAAAAIDLAVIGIATLVLVVVGTGIMLGERIVPSGEFIPGRREELESIFWSIGGATALVYLWLFTGILGRTVGKFALGIQVVSREGKAVGLGKAALREILLKPLLYLMMVLPPTIVFFAVAFIRESGGRLEDVTWRWFVLIIPLIVPAISVVGLLWMVWDQQRQGWHDKLAKSYVVKRLAK